jgi:hypothetical protein
LIWFIGGPTVSGLWFGAQRNEQAREQRSVI